MFPATADELSAEWLTGALRSRGELGAGLVSGFEAVPLSEPGQTADLVRIHLRYDGDPGGAPSTLVAKMPARFEAARALAAQYDSYAREVGFYRYFWYERELPIPKCYAAEVDAASGRFVLLLEDLGAARNGSLFADSVEDVERGLCELAKIHARFWGRTELLREPWIRPSRDPAWIDMLRGVWGAVLPAFRAQYGGEMSDYAWTVATRWLEVFDCMKTDLGDPETLLHVDAHPKQMFFPTSACERFVLFDWQAPGFGPAAGDVARLVVCGLSPENRRVHEERLFRAYLDAARAQGVETPPIERLRFGVRVTNLWNFFISAIASLQTDTSILAAQAAAEGVRWEDVMCGRIGSALVDWNTLDALDQLVAESSASR